MADDALIAAKAQVVADGIVDAFVATLDGLRVYYAEHPDHRGELVEKVAGMIERGLSRNSDTHLA